MSVKEMREYYETVHVPLARRTFPQIVEHRRNWLGADGQYFPKDLQVPEFDCITEIWFENRSGFDEMMKLVSDPIASIEIKEDERRFLEPTRCGIMIVDETVGLGARR